MPSRDELAAYRAALYGGRSYQAPRISDYGDYGGGSLGDLIGRRGQAQAQYHLAGADTLAQGFRDALGGVASYFGEREQKKEMAKRDAATLAAIEGWDGQDPMSLYKSMLTVRGPEDAMQYTNQVLQLKGGPKKDPNQELERVGKSAQFFKKLSPEMQATAWPEFRKSLGPSLAQLGLGETPEAWDPQHMPLVDAIGSTFGPKEEKEKPIAVDGAIWDPNTGQFTRPPAKPAEPKVVDTVDERGRPISKAVTQEELAKGVPKYVEPKDPREPREEPLVQIDVNGVPTYVPRSQAVGKPAAQAARGATGSERQALNFYNRARQASEDVLAVEDAVTGAGVVGRAQLQYAPNWAQTGDQQKYRQAQRAFTEARLRKDSGATIKDEEYENDARTYFAQPGDSDAVKAQKRAARQEVLQGLAFASGRAYEEFYGQPQDTPRRTGKAAGGGTARVTSAADYAKLPSGAEFIDDKGKRWRKP